MIVIHAADIHLGSTLGGLDSRQNLPVDLIRNSPLAAFERIAKLCEERGADLLVLAGDLFDKDASQGQVIQAMKVLRRISDAGTQIVTLRGNHDAQYKMRLRLPDLPGVHELPSDRAGVVDLPELGIAVHGRGFDTPHVSENIVLDYMPRIEGRCNIGLLHTSLEGNAAHATYAPCSVADLEAHGYDYWALGHIHRHAIVRRAPWVVYAGSPTGRHIGETGDHGAYVFTTDGSHVVTEPEHVELGVVRWHHVAVDGGNTDDDAETLLERAGAAITDELAPYHDASEVEHVVRVTFTGRCAAHLAFRADPDQWRDQLHVDVAALPGARAFVERVRFRTEPPLPDPAELHKRHDAVGKLAVMLDADALERAARDDASDLATEQPMLISQLDSKLKQLGPVDVDLPRGEVTVDELAAASDDLLARLVAAGQHAEQVDR